MFPSIPRHLLAYLWAQLARQPWLSLQCGVRAARQCHHASGRDCFPQFSFTSSPLPLSCPHLYGHTPVGEATAKGQCPHSIQHLQYLPGLIRPLLLWCAHQPPVLSDSGPEGLCCRMPVDATTDSDQDKTSTAPPPLVSAGPVYVDNC